MSEFIPKKIGKFRINRETIENNPKLALDMLKDIIVIRAELMYDTQAIEYIGLSENFESKKFTDEIPFYVAVMWHDTIKNKDGELEYIQEFKNWEKAY